MREHMVEEQRKEEVELAKKLEEIAHKLDKEPWDDNEADDITLDLPLATRLLVSN